MGFEKRFSCDIHTFKMLFTMKAEELSFCVNRPALRTFEFISQCPSVFLWRLCNQYNERSLPRSLSTKIVNEYDQEIPQSQTADKSMVS